MNTRCKPGHVHMKPRICWCRLYKQWLCVWNDIVIGYGDSPSDAYKHFIAITE